MKSIFSLLLIFTCLLTKAQPCDYTLSFDPGDTLFSKCVFIDTANHNNIWQIGKPNKSVFTSAYSYPNAIVTDTLNPYPANDSSAFIIKMPRLIELPGGAGVLDRIRFYHKLDIAAGDSAAINASIDSGKTWLNLNGYFTDNFNDTVDFTSSTNGWKTANLQKLYIILPMVSGKMNIYIRFMFRSGTSTLNKNGWMLDNICMDYQWEGAVKNIDNTLITVSPNPSDGHIRVSGSIEKYAIINVFNLNGQKVYETTNIPTTEDIYLNLPDGIYMLKYTGSQKQVVEKLIISH